MNIILFFTRGVSLKTWDSIGMFDREVALYCRLHDFGYGVSFVSYGDGSDLIYANRLMGIKILCNKWRMPKKIYELLIPFLHWKYFIKASVFKTNQTSGAVVALRTAKLWRKPLIARCGYMWSEFARRETSLDSVKYKKVCAIEKKVFTAAKRVVVTTPLMAKSILNRIPEAIDKTVVIPNYVDINNFAPNNKIKKEYDLLFIGRIANQKNVSKLLDAVVSLPVSLAIVGEGELKSELEKKTEKLNGRITWMGNVGNYELPVILNKARIFILPSFYEGHPKTLLEAMSCGLPVIGTNVSGIRGVIKHGYNGWLCDTGVKDIRKAIKYLLSNPKLCKTLGKNARQYILDNVSLDRVFKMELQVLESTIGD